MLWKNYLIYFCFLVLNFFIFTANASYTKQQYQYLQAKKALKNNNLTKFNRLYYQLAVTNYPLLPYLNYQKLLQNKNDIKAQKEFIQNNQNSHLRQKIKYKLSFNTAKKNMWHDFLAINPEEPASTELKCFYLQAKLNTKDEVFDPKKIKKIWLSGKSLPKSCDPLFKVLYQNNELSKEDYWQRALLGFANYNVGLIKFLAKKQPSTEFKNLVKYYYNPALVANFKNLPKSKKYQDIYVLSLQKLAKINPHKALIIWLKSYKKYNFSEDEKQKIRYAIISGTLLKKEKKNLLWIDKKLAKNLDQTLIKKRLHFAVLKSDWPTIYKFAPFLDVKNLDNSTWFYYLAISAAKLGLKDESRKLLETLSNDRSFYGYLAADALAKPYKLNAKNINLSNVDTFNLVNLKEVIRIKELMNIGDILNAKREWFYLISNSSNSQKDKLSLLALNNNWHFLAIEAANRAKSWDNIDARFPLVYQDKFQEYAQINQVEATELMAIARRESSFYPNARSQVGARGLMQLMPNTARYVAKREKLNFNLSKILQIDTNLHLGSSYYKELLDKFNNNRVLAIASYNAGPHRVTKWHKKSKNVDVWIESIPFKETRQYVKAVLFYNVIFAKRQGSEKKLLTNFEKRSLY